MRRKKKNWKNPYKMNVRTVPYALKATSEKVGGTLGCIKLMSFIYIHI